jgi:hypothetical protein
MRWPDSFATLAPDLSMLGFVLGEMRSIASHGTGAKLQMAEPAPSSGASSRGCTVTHLVSKDFFSRQRPAMLCAARTQMVTAH